MVTLKKPSNIRNALSTATYALLGTSSHSHAALNDWQVDSAFLYYSEKNRVTAIEPVTSAEKELRDDEWLRLRLVIDSLTGESPSGAIPQPMVQTFTGPSGSRYNSNANSTPLDPTFKDTRAALNVEWELPIDRDRKTIWGANVSREFDYTAFGASGTYSIDTDNKNRTLTSGLSIGLDFISPVGDAPVALTEMPDSSAAKQTSGGTKTKTLLDTLIGVTQVIDRKTLLQCNYTLSYNNGYLTDPYKILSNIDSSTGNIRDLNPDPGTTAFYRFEARPDSRLAHALFVKWVHQFNRDVLNVSYRYFLDDWGIDSHTIDMRYRFELGGGHYLQPHLRWYQQSAADFYTPFLRDGDAPRYASADYRLAELTTKTIGIGYGIEFSDTNEFSMRLEQMTQSVTEPEKFGSLSDLTLLPDVNAIIVQLGYKLRF